MLPIQGFIAVSETIALYKYVDIIFIIAYHTLSLQKEHKKSVSNKDAKIVLDVDQTKHVKSYFYVQQ